MFWPTFCQKAAIPARRSRAKRSARRFEITRPVSIEGVHPVDDTRAAEVIRRSIREL
jgi:hypothetical protein